MVAPENNWKNTKKFFNNRRKTTATSFTINEPQRVTLKANRGRNNRRYVTRLNDPRANQVSIINGIKPSVATHSRSLSPSYAINAEKINISGHRVSTNTLKMNRPLKGKLFTVKGKPTLKRNFGKRYLNVNNSKIRHNRNNVSIDNFIGVINE